MPQVGEAGSRRGAGNRGALLILGIAIVVLVAAGAAIYFAAPGRAPTASTPFASIAPASQSKSAVVIHLTLDSVNASTGSASLRIVADPGPALPHDGAVVFSTIGGAPVMVVHPEQLSSEKNVQVPFAAGSVSDYPFDDYRLPETFAVLSGTDRSYSNVLMRRSLPFQINGTSTAAGVVVASTHHVEGANEVTVTMDVRRTPSTKGWVLAMMAIYWVLALGAAAIAIAVIAGLRPFETRLLAWLSALLFALITFRTAAPADPPIGTFLDFAATFEAVGIVSASLLALMVLYLARSRVRLKV